MQSPGAKLATICRSKWLYVDCGMQQMKKPVWCEADSIFFGGKDECPVTKLIFPKWLLENMDVRRS